MYSQFKLIEIQLWFMLWYINAGQRDAKPLENKSMRTTKNVTICINQW